ncbi:DUF3891 family protein [Mechercharimyces sp. CAU 1602]|uniref:DUF3891 family protein n=1 Tax=Mechercharimyces sp. CAU 1602 TaxID=2973933 RepID=UPI002162D065|nr:DUF3891 family protein [Mechercharimyces sp. CAU 1602]MCS1351816.1 DUF3891 family protein [Mechercharimyces sp. CAU 1602]
MIVREQGDEYLLITQHDHGLLAGEFAVNWRFQLDQMTSTLFAIAYHDVAWRELDKEICWNEDSGAPYSFIDFPLVPKLPAYKRGIDRIQAEDAYAGALCSLHFASFFSTAVEEEAIRFYRSEQERQQQLRTCLGECVWQTVAANYKLLQFCDDLSLFICLNEPGVNHFPWYKEGILYQGETWLPQWEGKYSIRLQPNPFRQSFTLTIPYQRVNKKREWLNRGSYQVVILGNDTES